MQVNKKIQHKLILITGSNIGNRFKFLQKAEENISKQIGVVTNYSAIYETAAWGNLHQPAFLNRVLIVQTNLDARKVLNKLLLIEKRMGRIRTAKNEPRIIDIDILFYDKEIIHDKNLQIPHPRIEERRFVLTPLNQLIPAFKHPVHGKSMHILLLQCKDKLKAEKWNPVAVEKSKN